MKVRPAATPVVGQETMSWVDWILLILIVTVWVPLLTYIGYLFLG